VIFVAVSSTVPASLWIVSSLYHATITAVITWCTLHPPLVIPGGTVSTAHRTPHKSGLELGGGNMCEHTNRPTASWAGITLPRSIVSPASNLQRKTRRRWSCLGH
jgi:hypothetical protein